MKELIISILVFFGLVKPQTVTLEAFQATPTVIQRTGLPDKHLIETTFIPQAPEKNWDQPWQDACEEAALLNAHYYYLSTTPTKSEIVANLNKIFEYETTQSWTHDINQTQMASMSADLWNYQAKVITNPTVEMIKEYLVKDIPVIVTANGKTLYRENKRFKSGGPWYHALTILGYDDNEKKFIVHDVGTQFGAYFKYSYNLLLDSIHDFPTTLKKEDIDSGIKSILILLK